LLGWAHDIGKLKPRFQARLSDATIIEPHAAEGARYIRDTLPGPLGQIMAQAVLGHHAGLPDAGGAGRDLNARLDTVEKIDMPQHWQIPRRSELLPEALSCFDPKTPGGPNYALSFFGRMAFSALIDADRSETAAYYDPTARAAAPPGLISLRAKLDETMSKMSVRRPIDDLRKTVHEYARSCASQDPGLFTLTVPTGGGKTLTSLGFALDHAIAHGMDRIIFVIPYTSIVEQTADVFRNVFGELGAAAVLEHHASFDNESIADENDRRVRNMAA
jgi:CRISPR-associated endonuclease/helicase Cas3